jgi:hypothetical protein
VINTQDDLLDFLDDGKDENEQKDLFSRFEDKPAKKVQAS